MTKPTIIFLLLQTSILTYGQVTIKEIGETNPNHKNEKYIFLQVIVPSSKVVSDKINNDLISDFLDIEKKEIKKSIFENIWKTEEIPIPRLSDLSYSVLSNTKKFLSISISADGCGAYCEYFTNYYNYNLKTGKRIRLDSIFNKQGSSLLLDSINLKKKQILKTKLIEIQDSLTTKSIEIRKEDKAYFEDMKALYQDCLENIYELSFEYLQFYFSKKELFVFLGRCSHIITETWMKLAISNLYSKSAIGKNI